MRAFTVSAIGTLLVASLLGRQGLAHNGQVAVAIPLSAIRIDGNFSDWPGGLRTYSISRAEDGDRPDGSADFQGSFRVGYDTSEHALYAAIEVIDDSTVIDSPPSGVWDSQDGCSVFLQAPHGGAAPVSQYNNYGEFEAGLSGRLVQSACRRDAGVHRYEWRVDLAGVGVERGDAVPAIVLGFDVAICDRDEDGSFSWLAWGKGALKVDRNVRYGDRLGDLILTSAPESVGHLRGQILRQGRETGFLPEQLLRAQSLDRDSLWVDLQTETDGSFGVDLPAGSYRVSPQRQTEGRPTATITRGETSEVVLTLGSGAGQVVKAGPGARVNAGPGSRRPGWHHLGSSDGLALGPVTAVAQGRDGSMWIGGTNGLSRYDGDTFTTFGPSDGLPHVAIDSLFVDHGGDLWIGSVGGLSRYDGKNFTNYTREHGLAVDEVYAVLEDRDGVLWIGGPEGLVRGEAFTKVTELAGKRITALLQDHHGVLWAGAAKGVFRRQGDRFEHVEIPDFPSSNGPAMKKYVWSLLEDRHGTLWIGVRDVVLRYDGEHTERFILDSRATALFMDREGFVWLGRDDGLYRRCEEPFSRLDLPGERSGVYSVLKDRHGVLWLGFSDGLGRYQDGRFRLFTTEDGLRSDFVLSLLEDRRGPDLWVGTTGGVHRFDGERFTAFSVQEGLPHNRVSCLLEDRRGRMWMGSGGGLSRLDDGERFTSFTTRDGLVHDDVRALVEDRNGHIWIATNVGVSRFDGDRFTNYGVEHGLVDARVHTILEDRAGILWFGSLRGLTRFDGDAFERFTFPEMVAQGGVLCLAEDSVGHLWMGTGTGIVRFDGFAFQSLNRRDGFIGGRVHCILPDGPGTAWIGSDAGISSYSFTEAPPILSAVDVDTDHHHGAVDSIRMPSSQPVLSFGFQAISFKTRPEAMLYRYRLLGHGDDAWRSTHRRSVEYRELPVGSYTFEVQAIDRDLGYSDPARVAVDVHPAYGQIAMLLSLGLALVLLLWLSKQLATRSRRVREQRRLLAESEQKYRSLVEGLPGQYIFYATDFDGAVTYVSPSVKSVLGYPRKKVLGRPWREFFDFDDPANQHALKIQAELRSGKTPDPYEVHARHAEGSTRTLEVRNRPILASDGTVMSTEGIVKDVSERKRAELALTAARDELELRVQERTEELVRLNEELHRSEERYRSIVEDQTEFIVRWLPGGTRTFVNDAYCREFGLTREQCIGTSFFALIDEDDRQRVRARVERLTREHSLSSGEHRVKRPDGSMGWQRWTDRAIFKDDRLVEFQSVGRDITARKRAEEEAALRRHELHEAEKLIALGTLVFGVTHEINNPNHVIALNLAVLRKAWEAIVPILDEHDRRNPGFRVSNLPYRVMREEIAGLIEEVGEASDRIKHVVDQLKDYSRNQNALPAEAVDVNQVIRSALTLLGSPIRETARLTLELGMDNPEVLGNARQLEQVVVSLVLNAREALRAGEGTIRIGSSYDPAKQRVTVTVEDDGCGIPEENMARILDPFFTTKREVGGTGLGLAVANRILKEHGGGLTFESGVGMGTRARLFLNLHDKQRRETADRERISVKE